MLPILQPAQVGRDDPADGPRVGRAVGVAAHVAIDRADVQARAAADAVERVALFGVGQQRRAVVVEQDDVELLRAVRFARLARAAVHRVVAADQLPGTHRRQHRQEQGKVFQARHHFLDAEQRDHGLRQRGGEPGVALVLGDGDHAGLRDGEVRAGDAHVRLEVLLTQHAPGDQGQFLRIV